jgi:hypothetical protein
MASLGQRAGLMPKGGRIAPPPWLCFMPNQNSILGIVCYELCPATSSPAVSTRMIASRMPLELP